MVRPPLTERRFCAGFSLIDLLLAMAIFSIGITGLLRYHQTLTFQFRFVSETQQAWRLAYQLLDIYPESPPPEFTGWRYSTQVSAHFDQCVNVKAQVQSLKGGEAVLTRIICPN